MPKYPPTPPVAAVPDLVLEVYKSQLDYLLLLACMEGMMRGAMIAYDHAYSCARPETCVMLVADTIRGLWERLEKDL